MAREITLGEMRRLVHKPTRVYWYSTLLDTVLPDRDCTSISERLVPCLTGSAPLAAPRTAALGNELLKRLEVGVGSAAHVPYFEALEGGARHAQLRCEPTKLDSERLRELQILLPAFVHKSARQCPPDLRSRLLAEPPVIRGVLASAYAECLTTVASIADNSSSRTYVFARFPLLMEPMMRREAVRVFAASRHQFVSKVALRQLGRPESVAALRRAIDSTLADAPPGRKPIWAKVLMADGIDAHPLSLAAAIGLTVDERGENAARSLKSRVMHRLREYEFKCLANAGLLIPALAEYLVVEHGLSIDVVQPVLQSIGMRSSHAGEFARDRVPQLRRLRHAAPR